jgi:hypothetical protein
MVDPIKREERGKRREYGERKDTGRRRRGVEAERKDKRGSREEGREKGEQ